MTVRPVTDEKIAETSSKGNQEKWYDQASDRWYKLDQFGYEALAETAVSLFLERSNVEMDTPFTFVRYQMERLMVHGRERTGCSSKNFLRPGQALITVNRLLSSLLGKPLREKLTGLPSGKRRVAYLAEATADITGLELFPQYLTLLFEIDALFCNDDRRLDNIAVLEQNGQYGYCPIFDNGAGLLSNTRLSPMDIAPPALISALQARPFNTTFTRQMNTARSLYGAQLIMPKLTVKELREDLIPLLEYYPQRDRDIIAGRAEACVLTRQKKL